MSTNDHDPHIRLSICIGTFNRANFIGATLDSIIQQLTEDCEIVISDNASTDNTGAVISEFTTRFKHLRYVRQAVNAGFDRNYDKAVELARGEYCWLMADDDLFKPAAVATVLLALRRNPSLVVVNAEFRDLTMTTVLKSRLHEVESDQAYSSDDMDQLFKDIAGCTTYVGSVVIKRAVWLARDRTQYYDSYFIQVGVIFQKPLPAEAIVIAQPLVSVRQGNARSWWGRSFEIFMIKWPSLVWSLAPSESAKRTVSKAEPWKSCQGLLLFRAFGSYSIGEYRRLIHPHIRSYREAFIPIVVALTPGPLVLVYYVFLCLIFSRYRWIMPELRNSPFHPRNWKAFRWAS